MDSSFGGADFFFKETVAVLGASLWAFLFTYGMLWMLSQFMRVSTTEAEEMEGVDEAIHGESAYLQRRLQGLPDGDESPRVRPDPGAGSTG